MKRLRDYYITLVLALLLTLTVCALVFLPADWCEAKNIALLAGLQKFCDAMVWFEKSISRLGTTLVATVLMAIFLCGYLRLERRVLNLELHLVSPTLLNNDPAANVSADPVKSTPAPVALVSELPQDDLPKPKINGTPVAFAAPVIEIKEVRPPAEQLPRFIKATRRCKGFQFFPEAPNHNWSLGFACVKGNVREQNQDYGLHFMIGGRQVLIIADGCGGIPHGQLAAYLAVRAAASSIARSYGKDRAWHTCDAQVVARKAIEDASLRLTREGERLHLTNPHAGLRTTLIVVVGESAAVSYAYIGDGGGCIVRTDGAVEQFLAPNGF